MNRCVDCRHVIDGTSHDRCHTHADCAQGMLYFAGFCGICQDLWQRSREYKDDYHDAKEAFKILFAWVIGFGKNLKGREPGQDFFSNVEERLEFDRLRNILQPRKRSASRDSSRSSIPSKRVSITRDYSLFNEECY